MNKFNQNKITFTFILAAIAIIFSSLTILSLPVLFDYESKVATIEKNFYKNFKIYLNSKNKISYKPFPKPHLLVENASLNLSKTAKDNIFINTSNLKIFISLRDIYLRSLNNFISTEISNTNLELRISDIKELRKHLYEKINKQIILTNCKIFIKNKTNEVILISPVKKVLYKIYNKSRTKNLTVNGELFGLNFKSDWKRNYSDPLKSLHNINILNPTIDIKNIFEFKGKKKFNGTSQIVYSQDELEYKYKFNNDKINISSPNNNKTNFNINGEILLKPFYLEGELIIKNKKVETLIDSILLNLISYKENYLGNLNGKLQIKFEELRNKLIKKGEIDLLFKEKKISLNRAQFYLDNIGKIKTNMSVIKENEEIKFVTNNHLFIENHIEFAKTFQIGSNKIKNIKSIHFDLIKNIGQSEFIITNIQIENSKYNKKSDEIYIVKNIQNLRAHIRKVID